MYFVIHTVNLKKKKIGKVSCLTSPTVTDDNGSPENIKVGILEFYGVAVIY